MDDIENVDEENYRDQKMDGGITQCFDTVCCFVAFAQDTGNVLK